MSHAQASLPRQLSSVAQTSCCRGQPIQPPSLPQITQPKQCMTKVMSPQGGSIQAFKVIAKVYPPLVCWFTFKYKL